MSKMILLMFYSNLSELQTELAWFNILCYCSVTCTISLKLNFCVFMSNVLPQKPPLRPVASTLIVCVCGGGAIIHIHIFVLTYQKRQWISKEINCVEHEYMNNSPPN